MTRQGTIKVGSKYRKEEYSSRRIAGQLEDLEKVVDKSVRHKSPRILKRPVVSYPANLPIVDKKNEIVRAIRENKVVIISGDTGSGKSTQIPKMCLEAGRGIEGKIGCTQPRRIAVTTIAYRIAEELGEPVGKSVGYKIRFTDRTSPEAYIKIMTDGILLAEIHGDPNLYEYDTIIIDEAHERSVNIDFLLGFLKRLLKKRPQLKLVVSSATLDIEKFCEFFDGAPVIEVRGKVFPVEVRYRPPEIMVGDSGELTYVDMALEAVGEVRSEDPIGDILIFMPTEKDILETCERLKARLDDKQNILPLFARLPVRQQRMVYKVKGPKVVVATNVAETSLTIPGIKYVIDTGLARISRYVARTRTTCLPISPISKASAEQRKGRCGRVQRGVCIRLYSEEDYEGRPIYTPPEILRANLAEVILRMIYLRLGDIESFPLLDRPGQKSIKDGLELLTELGAIQRIAGKASLTKLGREMARLPLDPRISRMLLEARNHGCTKEVAIIAAALSIQDPRERPTERDAEVGTAAARFRDPNSDFMSLIKIWNAYKGLDGDRDLQRRFCKENFLSFSRMREWEDVFNQIQSILKEHGLVKRTWNKNLASSSIYERIHKCILTGFLSNIAVKKDENIYQGAKGKEVMIFPGSSLFGKGPEWIVAAEMIKTSRVFARTVAKVKPQWIEQAAGVLCKRSYKEPHWDKSHGKVMATEQVSVFGLVVCPGRTVPYGPINAKKAHEIFVREALVQGELEPVPGFLKHNQELKERLQLLEHKLRRRGVVADEEQIFKFYSERLPEVYDVVTLTKRIRDYGSDEFLRMTENDLLIKRPEKEELYGFPESLEVGACKFSLRYCFAPGKEEDGVTVMVPVSLAEQLPPSRVDWIVPGLLKEKVREMIKALPKEYRRKLIPATHTADLIWQELGSPDMPLPFVLSQIVEKKFGVKIPPKIWSTVEIPEYLKMRVSVVGPDGKELVCSRKPHVLKEINLLKASRSGDSHAWRRAKDKWERGGLKKWDFDSLPEYIDLGKSLRAYPALVEEDEGVGIRLFASNAEAQVHHIKGVKALGCIELAKELKFIKKTLKVSKGCSHSAIYFGGLKAVEEALFNRLVQKHLAKNIRTRQDFYDNLRHAGNVLGRDAEQLTQLVNVVLDMYAKVVNKISSIRTKYSDNCYDQLCHALSSDLKDIVPVNFLEVYDDEILRQLPRYLKALLIRAERASYDPEKDRRKREQLSEPLKYLRKMKEELSGETSEEKCSAVEEFRWMVEEFKVSVFAQEVGTAYPVSLARLRKKKEEIDNMV